VYRKSAMVAALIFAGLCCIALLAQKPDDDPLKKLSAFLGKWQSEGTFDNGTKARSELECRWSPQSRYLVCEQDVNLSSGHSHQLTIYGYDGKNGKYTYATFPDNGARPITGTLENKGNFWAYDADVADSSKPTRVRTTNEFTTPKTEVFKVYVSDDHGATWKTMLQGTAHKLAD
jgi:uncharacterized protein DUF1579